MRLFILSGHCQSGVHCTRCRDLVVGRTFRSKIVEHFAVPGGVVDFECPWHPWGYSGGFARSLRKFAEKHGAGWGLHRRRSRITSPGDAAAWLLGVLHVELMNRDCGCRSFRRKMNVWGWRGCWKRRGIVARWFWGKFVEWIGERRITIAVRFYLERSRKCRRDRVVTIRKTPPP